MIPSGIVELACLRMRQHPLRFGMLGIAILAFAFAVSSVLLIQVSIEQTANRVLNAGPSLIAGRLDAGGWAPTSVASSEAIKAIPGVVSVTPRVWGLLPGPPQTTIVGDPALAADPSQGVLSHDLAQRFGSDTFVLSGLDGVIHTIRRLSSLSPTADVVARDVVFVAPDLARRLLLIPDGQATDIAITSVRSEEDDALALEIERALGPTARVYTRAQMKTAYVTSDRHKAGLMLLLLVPATLTILLIAGQIAFGNAEASRDAAKLKMLGFTTTNIAALHASQTAIIAAVGAGLGWCFAYAALFIAPMGAILSLIFGSPTTSSVLSIDLGSASLSLLYVSALVVGPCLVASLVPALRVARTDPSDLIDGA